MSTNLKHSIGLGAAPVRNVFFALAEWENLSAAARKTSERIGPVSAAQLAELTLDYCQAIEDCTH